MYYRFHLLILATIISTTSCAMGMQTKALSPEEQAELDLQLRRTANYEEIKKLLDLKANVNTRTDYGNTPLFYAASSGEDKCIQLLLDTKADLYIKESGKQTALNCAITWKTRSSTVELLLNAGSDPNMADSLGNTPLHNALTFNRNNVVKILVQHPLINLDLKDRDNLTPLALVLDFEKNNRTTDQKKAIALLRAKPDAQKCTTVLRKAKERNHPLISLLSQDLFGEIEKELFQILVDDSQKQVTSDDKTK